MANPERRQYGIEDVLLKHVLRWIVAAIVLRSVVELGRDPNASHKADTSRLDYSTTTQQTDEMADENGAFVGN